MHCLFHSVSSGFQDSAKSVLFIAWHGVSRHFFCAENETNPEVSVENSGSNTLIGFQDVNWMFCPGKPLIVPISVLGITIHTYFNLLHAKHGTKWDPFSLYGPVLYMRTMEERPPAISKELQSFWLQIQRSRVRFPTLADFLRSCGSEMESTQPREDNWGATWVEK
jgi:hypothetical protein